MDLGKLEPAVTLLARRGMPLREIARQLGLKEASVRKLLENMSRKITAVHTAERRDE